MTPELQEMVRRSVPNMIRYDVCSDTHYYSGSSVTGGSGGCGGSSVSYPSGSNGGGSGGQALRDPELEEIYRQIRHEVKRINNERYPTTQLPTSGPGEGPGVEASGDDGRGDQTFEEQMAKYALAGSDPNIS